MKGIKVLLIIFLLVILFGCTWNVDYLKENGPQYFEEKGFEVLGYEGYQWSIWGGRTWFYLRRPEMPNVFYSHFLIKRGGEIHRYYGKAHEQSFNIDLVK